MGVDLFLAYHKRQIPLFVIVLFNATCELPHPYNKIGDGPEGPEVYLMGEGMRQIADQRNLLNLSVRSGKYVTKSLVNLERLLECLPQLITHVGTHGKFSWIQLANGFSIWLTYGMSGSIKYEGGKHAHLEFATDHPTQPRFYYDDSRNFGNVVIALTPAQLKLKLSSFGYDLMNPIPLSDVEYLRQCRRWNQTNICKFIMDQKVICGPGNYFKAEALYQCRISPYAILKDLNDSHLVALYQSMRDIARRSYQARGASLYTYSGTQREKGAFQDTLQVYGKAYDPLGNPVIKVDNTPDHRTTHYVPVRQTEGLPPPPSNSPPIRITLRRPKLEIKLKVVLSRSKENEN